MSPGADLALYDYWRSSAAYRVRLALACKGLDYASIPIDLRHGVQSGPAYVARNPQGLVPLLINGGTAIAQSLAIIEYLDETHPQPPLLPGNAIGRAQVRAAAQIVACDIHPLNNLRVLNYLRHELVQDQPAIDAWARHWITSGLAALEAFAGTHGGRYLHGDSLTLADLCLVPQLYNARRFGTDLTVFRRLTLIDERIAAEKFAATAHPDAQGGRVAPL